MYVVLDVCGGMGGEDCVEVVVFVDFLYFFCVDGGVVWFGDDLCLLCVVVDVCWYCVVSGVWMWFCVY